MTTKKLRAKRLSEFHAITSTLLNFFKCFLQLKITKKHKPLIT